VEAAAWEKAMSACSSVAPGPENTPNMERPPSR
jgi:hypothetical protein